MPDTATTSTFVSTNHNRYTAKNWLYRKHLDIFLEQMLSMLETTEPGSVLDAGCGEGFVVDRIAQRHPEWRLSGVDLSDEAIAYAKTHFGERAFFRKGSVYKLPFSDRSFDTVICSEVLEHLDDPNRAVAELKRVARGHVLITVPHEPYFQWLNTLGRRLGLNPDAGHVNFWTARTFEEFMRVHFDEPVIVRKQLYQLAVAAV